jgi:hypothetical protein
LVNLFFDLWQRHRDTPTHAGVYIQLDLVYPIARSLCSFSLVIAEVGSFYPVGWANVINLKMLMLSFFTFAHLTVTGDLLFVWQDFRRGTVSDR